jgi:hypothetical protein
MNLARAFEFLNGAFFDGKLPRVPLGVLPNNNSHGYDGMFSFPNGLHNGKIEITPDSVLKVPSYETMEILLHEMCHLYASANGIADTSASGIYHNTKFREIAEGHGLSVSTRQNGRYGWQSTRLKPSAKKQILQFLHDEAFNTKAAHGSATEETFPNETADSEANDFGVNLRFFGSSVNQNFNQNQYINPYDLRALSERHKTANQ